MELNELAMEIEHVDETLDERFELSLDAARGVAAEVDIDGDDREERIEEIERELDDLGQVNPMAVEEYEEARERRDHLEEQKTDLEEASADLREAIDRMNRESRRRFEETFEAVDEKFQTIFPEMYGGGSAQLRLSDPDDLLSTGVEIDVELPKERVQNVSLLSRGEKAITGASLIFSIFELKPTPFAVFDEVDAPLDEANVGRYVQRIRHLSQKSQMIVVTHNRRTMEGADTLYGLTMQEQGVSKIVSVRLDEVGEKLAS
ncbi:MAG: chromosome segregation protein SMC, partial [Bradymonadaceae bacterium]